MKKLKDVTINLKGVDQDTIDNLFNFASAFVNEYDIWVTDPGYDLVRDDTNNGAALFMATTSDSNKPYFIVHLATDEPGLTLCNNRPFNPEPPEYLEDALTHRLCEDCRLKALNNKETT